MGRRATAMACSREDRVELERIGRSRTEPKQRVERARIILACLAGEPQGEIAKRLGTRPSTISKWRIRFARLGLAGLADAPRSGKPRIYGPDVRTKMLALLETPPPKGQAVEPTMSVKSTVARTRSTSSAASSRVPVTNSWISSVILRKSPAKMK